MTSVTPLACRCPSSIEILWARNGTVPPPCVMMRRISGQRFNVPVKTRLTIARVVSNTYSTTNGGAPRFVSGALRNGSDE